MSSAAQLPPIKDVERLSPRVIRILGGNPGKFTLQGTNTYLIGTGPERILIDTAHGFEEWAASLSSVLAAERCTVTTALLTHWHPDHVLGVPDLISQCPGVRVYKHRSSVPSLVDIQQPADGKAGGGDSNASMFEITDGDVFATPDGRSTLKAVHCPGHTDDHVAFVLESSSTSPSSSSSSTSPATPEDEGALFAGDNVLGHGTSVFEDLAQYLDSLGRMRAALGPDGLLYPAHGLVVRDGRAKIDEYIQHRREREDQVLAVLSGSADGDGGSSSSSSNAKPVRADADERGAGFTPRHITEAIYKGSIDEGLLEAAEKGVIMILAKLEKDGKARSDGENWWLTGKAKF